jgi:DNA-binding SARP family transcriptional activator
MVFGSVRSSPGVSTAAVAVASCAPRSVLVDADPESGVTTRYRLAATPNLVTIAQAGKDLLGRHLAGGDAGEGSRSLPMLPATSLIRQSQRMPRGARVIAGLTDPTEWRDLWRYDADALIHVLTRTLGVTVIADAGRLTPSSPHRSLLAASDITVLIARADDVDVDELARDLAWLERDASRLGLLFIGRPNSGTRARAAALGVDVVGALPWDPRSVGSLRRSRPSRRRRRSPLLAAAHHLAADLAKYLPSDSLTPASPRSNPCPIAVSEQHGGGQASSWSDAQRAVQIAETEATATGSSEPPVLIRVTEPLIELLFDRPSQPASDDWTAEADGRVWSLARPVGGADGSTPPLLLCVANNSDEEILLNLPAASPVAVSGDAAAARRLLGELTQRLTARPQRGKPARVLLVGVAVPRLDLSPTESEAVDRVEETAAALAALERPAGPQAPPLVVVCDGLGEDSSELSRLADATRRRGSASLIALTDRPLAGATHITVRADHVQVLGLTCPTPPLPAAVRLRESTDESPTAGVADANEANEPTDVGSDPHIWVEVLGAVAVRGGDKPLTPRQTAVLSYVALHPDCTVESLEEAVWPEPRGSRRRQLHNTVSVIRSSIGPHHLPPAVDSRYRVGELVDIDLAQFNHHLHQADREPDAAQTPLRAALELVRGPVFRSRDADLSFFSWIELEGWIEQTDAKLISTASRLWRLCLDNGDTEGAIWAMRRGLRAIPSSTELTAAGIDTHLSVNDHASAAQLYQRHLKVLSQLGYDTVPAEVERLGQRIQRRQP